MADHNSEKQKPDALTIQAADDPLGKNSRETALSKQSRMHKRIEIKDDGRSLIYFHFTNEQD